MSPKIYFRFDNKSSSENIFKFSFTFKIFSLEKKISLDNIICNNLEEQYISKDKYVELLTKLVNSMNNEYVYVNNQNLTVEDICNNGNVVEFGSNNKIAYYANHLCLFGNIVYIAPEYKKYFIGEFRKMIEFIEYI